MTNNQFSLILFRAFIALMLLGNWLYMYDISKTLNLYNIDKTEYVCQ